MNKKFLLLALVAAVVLIVVAMKFDEPVAGAAVLFILVSLLVLQLCSFSKMKPCKDISELDDDDGGIDWREENVSEEEFAMWKGWAVLMDDVAVHEAKAAAETLEKAQIRCRLELLKDRFPALQQERRQRQCDRSSPRRHEREREHHLRFSRGQG